MPYKNPEDYKNWLRDRPGYLKDKMRQYRVEGRVSKGGVKYEFSPFVQFKNNPKYAQRLAKELFLSEGNSERCKQLEALGVKLQAGLHGIRPALQLKHACDKQCGFFGHVQIPVDIEPVAYKVYFRGEYEVLGSRSSNSAYWIFKRYWKVQRNPDFPEVRPEFHCEKCDLRIQFRHIDDMFYFDHTCRIHYAITVYTPFNAFNVGNIYNSEQSGLVFQGITKQQFYDWISKYHGLFFANKCRVEVRSAWGS